MNRLIFDRTIQDVDNATLKGQYNASDLNRVESWCEYLRDQLNAMGYPITFTTKTNWTQSDMRTASEMERIRANIKKIMQGFYYLTNIETNAEYFNYIKANNWEEILYEIYYLMFGTENWYVYGGVARGGQPRLWQHRFRQLTSGANLPTQVQVSSYYPLIPTAQWVFDSTSASAMNNVNAKFTRDDSTYGTFTIENLTAMHSTSRTVRYTFNNSITSFSRGVNGTSTVTRSTKFSITTPNEYCPIDLATTFAWTDNLIVKGVRKDGTIKELYNNNVTYSGTQQTLHITGTLADDNFFTKFIFEYYNSQTDNAYAPYVYRCNAVDGYAIFTQPEYPDNPQGPVLKLSTETGNVLTTESGEELEANL